MRDMASKLLKFLQDKGRFARTLIGLLNEEGSELTVFVSSGHSSLNCDSLQLAPMSGALLEALTAGKSTFETRSSDVVGIATIFPTFDPKLSFISVPIFNANNDPCGVIACQPPCNLSPVKGHGKFVAMLATLLGQSIQIARSIEQEQQDLHEQKDKPNQIARNQIGFNNIVGRTETMKSLFAQVRLVAQWNTTVLIRGESGTGKELIAKAIHDNSPRSGARIIKLNCAALPDNLLESELFGHEKGAFTGANTMRKGRFEQADGGTLFLDEIGEISTAFQSKLLRVLQEGEFERVGGNRTLKVDVRIITATNRNLETAVENGDFRDDLYYRINVMPLNMPPLRERKGDIPELAKFLLSKISTAQGRALNVTENALKLLMSHNWPGNVRELENCLERAAVMSQSGTIDRDVVSLIKVGGGRLAYGSNNSDKLVLSSESDSTHSSVVITGNEKSYCDNNSENYKQAWNDPQLGERERVIAALEEAGWVQAKAARLLGMTPRQIKYRIQVLDIQIRRI
ncbi:MAG: nif-specific transcriptional activator NifA [Hyphomicrobiaceae bacterium]|nr:nif-specific transcriptional activator NifA [Hyphomicrobiaceae bacterium]